MTTEQQRLDDPDTAGTGPAHDPVLGPAAPEPAGTDPATEPAAEPAATGPPIATGPPAAAPAPAASAAAALPVVVEPPQPARIRQPADLLRLLVWICVLGLLLLVGGLALRTVTGLEEDIATGGQSAPPFLFDLLVDLVGTVSGVTLLILPGALSVERLLQGEGRRLLDALLAASLSAGAAHGLNIWITGPGPDRLMDAITRIGPHGERTPPTSLVLCTVVAFVTVVGLAHRPRLQAVIWSVIAVDSLAVLLGGYATPLGLAVSVAVGRAIAFGARYTFGTANVRPPGEAVVAALRRGGVGVARCVRVDEVSDESRRYQVITPEGPQIDVYVLDRDQQGAGLPYRLYRRLRLRNPVPRRPNLSLRRELEHEALIAYAASAAGICSPRLVAATEVGPEAALLAYQHVPGRTLDEMADDELSDSVLVTIWRQLAKLQAHGLAHRGLTGGNILLDASGEAWLLDVRSGEFAAGDLAMRLDTAQLLATLALRVGARRAVGTASATLGPDAVAAALPVLQPVALSRRTRLALTRQRDLLAEIRERVLEMRPQAEVEPVRLERLRPRTLISVLAATAAAYFLLSQLTNVDLLGLLTHASWTWTALALAASAVSYLAASLVLMGFVPERLPLGRTVLAQLAASFVKLVAPAAVGGVAVNTRYVQRTGVPAAQAAASVGVAQVGGLGFHILLLTLFAYLTGTGRTSSLTPPARSVALGLGLLALAALVLAVPPVRRLVITRLRPLLRGVVPRLLEVLQRPGKLATGLGGTLLLTVAFVLCLYASVRAFGGTLGITTVAVIYLAGNALGSAAPTPGGLGAVEATLAAGLTAAGLTGDVAVSAVLLFRLMTFWLPVLPGWLSFTYLQHREAL